MSLVGTLGRVAIVPQEYSGWNIARAVGIIRLIEIADASWIKICLEQREMQHDIVSKANTTVQYTLNLSDLQELEIPFPDSKIRQGILNLVIPLDDKIELNRRMNRTLDQMARALFKSWFVDFDPVRAKMRGEQPEGMDAETAALFPDRLVEANGKEVPEGWGWTTIESMCVYLSRGITPRYSELDGIKVVNQKCIRNSQIDFSKIRRHDLSKSVPTEKLIQIGDVLVNSTGVGTLGRLAQVLKIEEAMTVDTHVTIVRPDESKVSSVFFGVQLDLSQAEIETLGTGSTGQTELSRNILGSYKFLLPNFDLMMAFEALVSPMRGIIAELQFESNHLAQFRDALLPQLLIGEVDLMQWEVQ